MFSNLTVYSDEMRTKRCITDSPQQNVATLLPTQTLYSAGMHINYRSINSKNISHHFLYDKQTSCFRTVQANKRSVRCAVNPNISLFVVLEMLTEMSRQSAASY